MRFGLKSRFLVSLLVILLFICGAFAYILTNQARSTLESNIDRQARSFAALSAKPIGDSFLVYKDSGSIRVAQQIRKFTDLDSNVTGVAITDVSGRTLVTNREYTKVTITPAQAASLSPSYLYQEDQLQTIIQPIIEDFGVHRYNIVYQISHRSVDAAAQTIAVNFVIYCLLGLAISLGLAYPILHYLFVRPVAKISHEALSISSGKLDQPIEEDRTDEIGDLARAVNSMAKSLKTDIAKLQEVDTLKSEFLIITSHNLRTPVSIMKGYLEQLEDMPLDDAVKGALGPIQASTLQLGAFAEEVLTISTIEAGRTADRQPTKLSDVIDPLAEQFQIIASQMKLNFSHHITQDSTVELNKGYLRTAVWNVLDNAAKFNKAGGIITLNVSTAKNQAIMTIKDNGIGIKPTEIPHLFTKFHRGTDTMHYQYEGMGIGLYVTKVIVEQHGGSIKVSSVLDQGTTVTLELPVVS